MRDVELLDDKDFFAEALVKKSFTDKCLSYQMIQNATVLPGKWIEGEVAGGIVTENGHHISNSHLHACCGVGYKPDKTEVRNETVIYLGMMPMVWGHCLTDNIRRLWFLLSEDYREKFQNCPIIFSPYPDFRMDENFASFMKIIGIDSNNLIPVKQATQYKQIILPDECFFTIDNTARYFTKEYLAMIGKVRKYGQEHLKELPFHKVYFTCSRYAGPKQIGENKLEHFFKEQGYKIISPERYSFEEQLNILLNCNDFASTVGSCSHNIIFLKQGANVILIPRAHYLTEYQLALDQVVDLNIKYISSDLSIFVNQNCGWEGPFYYFVSKKLLKAFGMEIPEDDRFWRKNFRDFRLYRALYSNNGNDLSVLPGYYYKYLIQAMKSQGIRNGRIREYYRKWLWIRNRSAWYFIRLKLKAIFIDK